MTEMHRFKVRIALCLGLTVLAWGLGNRPAGAAPTIEIASTDPSRPSPPTGSFVPEQPAVASGMAAGRPADSTGASDLVTNVFVDTSVREALSDIAMQTGQIIVPDSTVEGVVTCDLNGVPLEKALEIVLAAGNFAWKRMNGYILVGSVDPDSPTFSTFSDTQMLTLDYVPAKMAISLLSPAMQKYVRAADADAKTNQPANIVCITAPPDIIERLTGLLKRLDHPRRQILLDARIVVMERNDLLNLGLQWDWPVATAGAFSTSDLHEQGSSGAPWPWAIQVGYSPGKEFTNSLSMALNLMTQNEEATVVSSPQVLAQDGQESQIKVTTEEYFEIVTQGFYTNSQLEKIESGTILKIIPHASANGDINIYLNAEVSDVVARGENDLPVVTRRVTESRVTIRDGGTIAVSGLMDNRTRQVYDGVPYLQRIPLLGRLFRNDARSIGSRQVAMFITARLMAEGSASAGHAPHERIYIEPVGDRFTQSIKNVLDQQKKGNAR